MQPVSRPSVLLIEPHDDTREMYALSLALSGFDVVGTASGEDAMSRTLDADIVVTGLQMPTVDGFHIVRKLRQDAATSQKVVVVLTACAFDAARERAQAAGCDLFLTKPCSPHTLATELRRVLALRSHPPPR
jgi:CheY-like chemotaxis protein